MAKNTVSDWDTTAANNTDIGGITLAENVMKAPGVNNAFREMMAQLKVLYNAILNLVAFTAQSLTAAQQGQARTNIGVGLVAGRRNKVIDGRFQFCSLTLPVAISAGSSGYTFDLWKVNCTSGIACSANTATPVITFLGGRQYAQFAFTGTGIAGSNIVHSMEGVDILPPGPVTVSAYIADSVPQDYSVFLRQNFGTGGSPSASVDTAIGTMAAGANFTTNPLKVTGTLPSLSGKTLGTNNDHRLELVLVCSGANAHTLSLGDVAVVAGDATTEDNPSTPRAYSEESDLVARFIETSGGVASANISANVTSGATYRCAITYRVIKRTSASVTLANTTATNFPNSATTSPRAEGFGMTAVADGTGAGLLTYNWIADARY